MQAGARRREIRGTALGAAAIVNSTPSTAEISRAAAKGISAMQRHAAFAQMDEKLGAGRPGQLASRGAGQGISAAPPAALSNSASAQRRAPNCRENVPI